MGAPMDNGLVGEGVRARSQGEEEGRCVIAGVVSGGQEGREIADPVEVDGGQRRRDQVAFDIVGGSKAGSFVICAPGCHFHVSGISRVEGQLESNAQSWKTIVFVSKISLFGALSSLFQDSISTV